MKLKSLLATSLCLATFLTSAGAATVTGEFFGVSDYSQCGMYDRAGRQYCQNLRGELNASLTPSGQFNYSEFYDSNAKASTFKSHANSSTAKTLFVFSGHGYLGSTLGPVLYDSYVSKPDLKFKHRYVVMHTCNWLNDEDSASGQTAIYNTFNGTRLQMGFATPMYLDSREGIDYGQRMMNETVGSAFINAARIYQPKLGKAVVAKVIGYTDARYDCITSGKGAAPAYSNSNKNLFTEHFNVTIAP